MKLRKSFGIEEKVWNEFEEICKRLAQPYQESLIKSQLIESMIIGWNRKNITVNESNLKDNEK